MRHELSLDYLKIFVPSMFSEDSAGRTSDKYSQISTIAMLDRLRNEGFYVADASQSYSRIKGREKYTRHVLRFRHENSKFCSNGLIPEVVMVNSHDGLCSYRLMSGMYRIVCANGLITGNSYHEVRIRHQGDVMNNVIEGMYSVINNNDRMLASANEMLAIQPDQTQTLAIAKKAYELRFDDTKSTRYFDPKELLRPRRFEELHQHDLFTLFNVVQENIIKGRDVRMFNDRGYLGYQKLRGISSLEKNENINRGLWTFVEEMKQEENRA